MKYALSLVLIIPVLLSNAGCGGGAGGADTKPTYPVTGVLKLKGKPVNGGTVVIVATDAEGENATGTSDASGNLTFTTYKLGDGAVPGNYLVKAYKYQGQIAGAAGTGATQDQMEAVYQPPDAKGPPPNKNELPEKYASESTSGLKFTMTKGPTTLDLDLK